MRVPVNEIDENGEPPLAYHEPYVVAFENIETYVARGGGGHIRPSAADERGRIGVAGLWSPCSNAPSSLTMTDQGAGTDRRHNLVDVI